LTKLKTRRLNNFSFEKPEVLATHILHSVMVISYCPSHGSWLLLGSLYQCYCLLTLRVSYLLSSSFFAVLFSLIT
jgi:hypothetical protein